MNPKAQSELIVPLALAFALGILLMGTAYHPGVDILKGRWSAAIVAALVISAVGFWFVIAKRDVVDLEKAGDGCYYLGLIFTLFSLIVVLIGFGEDAVGATADLRTGDVISKFGVALSSTLAGVIFRVALQSFATDDEIGTEPLTPESAQALYGNSLAHATRRTLREMRTAEESFSRLARSARRQAESVEAHIFNSGQRAGVAASEAFERMEESIQKVERSVLQMQKQTEEHAIQIQNVRAEAKLLTEFTQNTTEEVAKHVSATQSATNDLRDSMTKFNADAANAAKIAKDVRMETEATVRASEHSSEVIKSAAMSTKEILTDVEFGVRTSTEDLKKTGEKTADSISKTHSEAAKLLEYAASNAKQELKDFHDDIHSVADNLKESGAETARSIRGSGQAALELKDAAAIARTEIEAIGAKIKSSADNLKEAGQDTAAAIASAQAEAARTIDNAVSNATRKTMELEAKVNSATEGIKTATENTVESVRETAQAVQALTDAASNTNSETKKIQSDVKRTADNLKDVGKEVSKAIAAAKDDAVKSIGDAMFRAKRASNETTEKGGTSNTINTAAQDDTAIESDTAETSARWPWSTVKK